MNGFYSDFTNLLTGLAVRPLPLGGFMGDYLFTFGYSGLMFTYFGLSNDYYIHASRSNSVSFILPYDSHKSSCKLIFVV